MDKKFTDKLSAFVNCEKHSEKEIQDAAMMLRQIAPRNMIYMRWYQLAYTRPRYIEAHVTAECRKHLKYRLDNLTREEVRVMDAKVNKEAQQIISEGEPEGDDEIPEGSTPKKLGRRDDHDSLPEDIKALWEQNAELYKKIKDKFEEIKAMGDVPACDRYEHLKILAELDTRYLKNMQKYDEYMSDGSHETPAVTADDKPMTEEDITKAVSAARSYISKNLGKYEAMRYAWSVEPTAEAEKKVDELHAKLAEKVLILTENNAVIKDELKKRLMDVDLLKDEEI